MHFTLHEFLVKFFGTDDLLSVLIGFIYAAAGAFVSLQMQSNKRTIRSPATPFKYSYSYLFCDNAKRILATILLILIFTRLFKEFLGVDATVRTSIFIGFGADKLGGLLKSITRNFFSYAKTLGNPSKTDSDANTE